MKTSIIVVLFSFLLEGILSNFINGISYLNPLFTIISLIIIYPFLYNKKNNYYKIIFITGIIYDIVYTNTLFFNALIFMLIGFLIIQTNRLLSKNIINIFLISILIIIFYRIATYTLLVLIGYIKNDIYNLFNSIYSSLFIKILYGMLLFKLVNHKKVFFINKYSKK